MIDTRHPIPKQFDDVYEEVARAVGVDPGAAILEPPLTGTEMAIAAKREQDAELNAGPNARHASAIEDDKRLP